MKVLSLWEWSISFWTQIVWSFNGKKAAIAFKNCVNWDTGLENRFGVEVICLKRQWNFYAMDLKHLEWPPFGVDIMTEITTQNGYKKRSVLLIITPVEKLKYHWWMKLELVILTLWRKKDGKLSVQGKDKYQKSYYFQNASFVDSCFWFKLKLIFKVVKTILKELSSIQI